MESPVTTRVTPRDITREIGRNMLEALEPFEYSTMVPNHYDVYLAPDDYHHLEPLFADIRADTLRKLNEELARLNEEAGTPRKGLLPWRRSEETAERYERKGDEWEVEFCIDQEDDALPGDLTIHSYFVVSRTAEYGAGSRTKRVVTRKAGTETQVVSVDYEDAAPAAGRPVVARIRYVDEQGEQVYEMRKDSIVIGRRDTEGSGYWADLRLDVRSDVSREHVRLRRDPATNTFAIKDLSKFGTFVDGEQVSSSMRVVDGQKQDLDRWVQLPAAADIDLAHIVTLHFESA